jgi:hypothetical protein
MTLLLYLSQFDDTARGPSCSDVALPKGNSDTFAGATLNRGGVN